MSRQEFDIAVIGGGATGLAGAIALARAGWDTALVGPVAPRADGRTVALMDGSLQFLDSIGAWQPLVRDSAPLATLTIIDDTGALLRAPPVSFHAGELDLDAFGRNIEAARLVAGLAEVAQSTPGLTLIDGSAETVDAGPDSCQIGLADGPDLMVRLAVGADGRDSLVRRSAGITSRTWRYEQSALTAIFAHDRDHRDTSTEFHTRHGPFTLVPLPGRRSSLVWLTTPREAERLAGLDDAAFAAAVERQAASILGAMRVDGPRGLVPMGGLSVDRFAGPRAVLIGEAAHVFPPIGAQGLNLGLRDVAGLIKILGDGTGDPGDPARLDAYTASRRLDVATRTAAVDALNRSLLAGFLPVDALRGAGLMALAAIGPLRRFVMRQGLGATT